MMKNYGLGGIYRPKNSSRFWIRYSVRGRQYRESSKSTSENKARALLKRRLGEIEAGKHTPRADKVTLGELLDGLVAYYRVNGRRSTRTLIACCQHLRAAFTNDLPALAITTQRLRQYVLERQAQKAANASIKRELAHLRMAFNLALQDGRLNSKPHVPSLVVDNARRGFLEAGDFARLLAALPADLQDFVHFLYLSGWRSNEGKTLTWASVDLRAREVKLDPRNSKTKQARTLPVAGQLLSIFERAHAARRLDVPEVFHRGGRPIRTFKHAWTRAVSAAGLTGLRPHDLRRSCVRNLIRAGLPEHTAMSWTGHATRAVFDRYDIVSAADLAAAAGKLESYLQAQQSVTKVAVLKSSIEQTQRKA
jgi:integrase